MLTLKSLNLDHPLYAFLAIEFAGKALPVWEQKYPEDMKPRKAIEAAKECLRDPSNAAAANAANAVHAAHAAAAAYAAAAPADYASLIHEVILENLEWILQYKIENGQGFAQPELILDYLDEEQKQRFLFNLDAVA